MSQPAIAPRCLNREGLAHYCGLSISGVEVWVRKGILPKTMPGTKKWDRKAVDAALDKISGLKAELAPLDPEDGFKEWEKEQNADGNDGD